MKLFSKNIRETFVCEYKDCEKLADRQVIVEKKVDENEKEKALKEGNYAYQMQQSQNSQIVKLVCSKHSMAMKQEYSAIGKN